MEKFVRPMVRHSDTYCLCCGNYFSFGYNPHPYYAWIKSKKLYFCSQKCTDRYIQVVKGATR